MSTIGERIKEERERLGMTIPEFAEVVGAKKNTVIDWQKDVSSPPAAKLAALATVGADLLYILTGTRTRVHLALAAVKTATEAGMAVEAITGNREDGLAVQETIVSQSILKPDEAALLDNYRNSLPEGKRAISTTSAAFAQQATTQKVSGDE